MKVFKELIVTTIEISFVTELVLADGVITAQLINCPSQRLAHPEGKG